jgi:hypothetical protein
VGDPHGDGVRPIEVDIHIRAQGRRLRSQRCDTCDTHDLRFYNVQLAEVAADLCLACLKTLVALASKEATRG